MSLQGRHVLFAAEPLREVPLGSKVTFNYMRGQAWDALPCRLPAEDFMPTPPSKGAASALPLVNLRHTALFTPFRHYNSTGSGWQACKHTPACCCDVTTAFCTCAIFDCVAPCMPLIAKQSPSDSWRAYHILVLKIVTVTGEFH